MSEFGLGQLFSNIVKSSLCFDLKLANVGFVGFFRFYNRQILRRRASKLINEDNATELPIPENSQTPVPRYFNESAKSSLLPIGPDEELIENEKKFKSIATSFRIRSFRERKQKLLLEGTELINMALNAGLTIDKLFYSKEDALLSLSNYRNLESVKKYKVRERTLRDFNDNVLSVKVLAVCKKPSFEERDEKLKATIPVTLLCSDIRDPGNMASILTLAAATGCKKVLLLKGCVDVWERKVLRSANGAHFNIPILNNIAWDDIRGYFPANSMFYVADSSSDIDIEDYQFHVDGNNVCDSQSSNEHNAPEFATSNTTIPSKQELGIQISDSENLMCKLYSEITFPNRELFLYVGGETVGINDNVKHLACELGALKIKLPLANNMDSLNVSVALSIILYEIKRQFMKKHKAAN